MERVYRAKRPRSQGLRVRSPQRQVHHPISLAANWKAARIQKPTTEGQQVNIDDLYPSKTIRAEELTQPVDVTVEAVELVEFRPGEGDTVVLGFMGKAQGLSMNKTRNMVMKGLFGKETDNWINKTIRLFSMPSRKPDGTPCMTVVIQKAPELASDPPAPGGSDEIPF